MFEQIEKQIAWLKSDLEPHAGELSDHERAVVAAIGSMQALLDDCKRMRAGIDAIYNYSDEAREAVIECYGLHHNSALDKLKEITSATD